MLEQAAALRDRWMPRASHRDGVWPSELWNDCIAAGVLRWIVPRDFDGDSAAADAVCEGCLELGRGNLLVAFVLSQFQAACQRIAAATNENLKRHWLPKLVSGECFATVGISHLTTSRQYLTRPAVFAEPHAGGYRLNGEVPWVTGARRADVVVIGGTLADGAQVLAAVPRERMECSEPLPLLALGGSETGPVRLKGVQVGPDELIAGPVPNVLQAIGTGGAGSLTTSALAVGHALACIDEIAAEAAQRPALQSTRELLQSRADVLRKQLLESARGVVGPDHSSEQLRTRATDLALNASQALLTASKGAGFVAGHPAERLAREALFFLVWSCPQAVAGQLLEGFGRCDW